MDIFERVLLLKQSTVFSAVRTDDLRALAPFLEPQEFVSGDTVFELGDMGEHMYLVESGSVGIYLRQEGSTEMEISRLGRGECFGEMNLLDELPRSASARVLEDAVLLSLEKQRLRGLIANHPQLALGMLKSLSLKIRHADARLGELT